MTNTFLRLKPLFFVALAVMALPFLHGCGSGARSSLTPEIPISQKASVSTRKTQTSSSAPTSTTSTTYTTSYTSQGSYCSVDRTFFPYEDDYVTCYMAPNDSVDVSNVLEVFADSAGTFAPPSTCSPGTGAALTPSSNYPPLPGLTVSGTYSSTHGTDCQLPDTMSFSLRSSSSLTPNQGTVYTETAQGVFTCCGDTPLDVEYSAPITIYSIAAVPCATPGTPGPNSKSPVAVTIANGNGLTSPAGQPIMRPDDGHDPAFFITQGTANASLFTGTIVSLTQLPNFSQGGPWDEQRVGGSFNPAYTNYATIAIGLFAAAAGIPESVMLGIEDAYAAARSTFQPYTLYDSTYSHLPEKNVQNTTLGYNLYQSNAFNVCK